MDNTSDTPRSGKDSARTFVQTGRTDAPQLDTWVQVTQEEARVVYEMTLRNELSGGTPEVRAFEDDWRKATGLEYVVATCNGTAALYSAMFGLGVGPGDEVLCPTYTWIGSIAPVPFLHARPVFCESDPRTLQLDPDDVRRRITPNTRAIIAVHLWGWVCDMDALMQVSRETGVPVIEDCSHAHGATYKGRPVGSMGDVGCWSLQGSKPVSGGEGGVLATNNVDVFERACLAGQVNRVVGIDQATQRHQDLQPLGTGMKFRAHPLACGIARVQLQKLPGLNQRRGDYVRAVETGLADIPFLEPIPMVDGAVRGGWYGFPVRFLPTALPGRTAQDVVDAMQAQGLAANLGGYPLLHRLPYFAKGFDLFTRGRGPLCGDYPGYREGDLPVTEALHAALIFLPMLSDPTPGAADAVLEILRGIASRPTGGPAPGERQLEERPR